MSSGRDLILAGPVMAWRGPGRIVGDSLSSGSRDGHEMAANPDLGTPMEGSTGYSACPMWSWTKYASALYLGARAVASVRWSSPSKSIARTAARILTVLPGP